MPASLLSLEIRGVRSYSPNEVKTQTIEFMPLTLIVGSNGNGKTTIIEALKFVISGEEPPLSDSRRNFLNSTAKQLGDKRTSYASIKLNFQSAKEDTCVAKREIYTPTGKAVTPSVLSSYKVANNGWMNIHKQDDWAKTVPLLFNLPNEAMLNNVILCHQEENLWCMGQSAEVKQIFDKIFGCEQYKREIKNIDAEIKNCKSTLVISEKDVSYEKEKVDRKKSLNYQIESMKAEIDKITSKTQRLDEEIDVIEERKDSINQKVKILEKQKSEISLYEQKIHEYNQKEAQLRKTLKTSYIEPNLVSDEELNKKMKDHCKLFDDTKQRQSQLKQREALLEREINHLKNRKTVLQDEINKLEVMSLKLKDSNETLVDLLKEIKIELAHSSISSEINPIDIEVSLEALKNFEQILLQNKSDQCQSEDKLFTKQRKLSKSINNLEGTCQGYLEKIKSKENYLVKLNNQIAQADPVAKDLLIVNQNLEKMSSLTHAMPKSGPVSSLNDLIEKSSDIVENLIDKIATDGVVKIRGEITSETEDLQINRTAHEEHQQQIYQLKEQLGQIETDLTEARTMTKEAHNTILKFKSCQSQVQNCYTRYLNEKKMLETKNMDDKVGQMDELKGQIDSRRKELNSLAAEYSKLSDLIGESFERYEEYQNNIQIREVIGNLKSTRYKLSSLGDASKLDKDLEKLNSEYKEEVTKFLEIRDTRARIGGSKTQIACQMERLRDEVDSLCGINRKYAETLGKIICNKIVLSDLEKLKECFQESIIAFHNQMIVKINEVLRVRWRQIYRGSDIDHIELVDEEITRGKDKKTFNYYIAMKKGGVRMKMREKSSAGQKALASIILRMTLTELFVKDFAFIALDEPTANLDLDNVQSLAKAIGSYVKRRNQRGMNIQWIIITHNEQFLRALNSECSPYYYRVQLDDEGFSRIFKVSYQDSSQTSETT